MDKIVRAINGSKEFSITTCVATDMMKEIAVRQGLVTGFSNKVSDLTVSNILMVSSLKDKREEIGMLLKTDGMLSQIVSNGDCDGNFSSYGVLNANSKKGIIGEGVLEVKRFFDCEELRTSIINVEHENISDIIADYYFQSEQVYSVVILGSLSDKKNNEIYASCGILIQLLPNASEGIEEEIAKVVSNISNISRKVAMGASAEDLVKLVDSEATILSEESIRYSCKCSKESTLQSINSIDISELKRIIEEDGELNVVCNSCNTTYTFNLDDLNE